MADFPSLHGSSEETHDSRPHEDSVRFVSPNVKGRRHNEIGPKLGVARMPWIRNEDF